MPSAGVQTACHQEDNVLSYTESAVGPTTAPAPATGLRMSARPKVAPDSPESDALLQAILISLDDDKAEDIVTIPLRGRSEMADFMVVCSGRSTRQVASIADKLMDRLTAGYGMTCKVEGKETGDWVLIDAGDVIVHVFRPEVRDFYQLEKMWMPTASFAGTRTANG